MPNHQRDRGALEAEFGRRPTDKEVREARAAGLPNPRWKRQNAMWKARREENQREWEVYAQQTSHQAEARNFDPTKPKPAKPKTQAEIGREKEEARLLREQRTNYETAIKFDPTKPKSETEEK